MNDNARRTGPALESHYQFLAWLVPTLAKFPKSHKFTLGDRIQNLALDVLEALIEATYSRERTAQLRRANLGMHAPHQRIPSCYIPNPRQPASHLG